MTDFAHRYHVGITSVLGRCAAIAAAIMFLPIVVAAKIDETSSVDAAMDLIDEFEGICSRQIESGEIADKSHLITLSDDQIASLSQALGYPKRPAAIWLDRDAVWYQVQPSLASPETCLFVSFKIALEDMQSAWNTKFEARKDWQSFSEAVLEEAETDGGRSMLTGAYAFRRYEGRVIMAGVAGMQFKDTGVVLLRYQKTKDADGAEIPGEDG